MENDEQYHFIKSVGKGTYGEVHRCQNKITKEVSFKFSFLDSRY